MQLFVTEIIPMDLNRIEMFAEVVKQGSFTGAARQLGLTKATISRKVAELETDTGVQLLFRTTRKLKLTEAGATYYNRVSKILVDLKNAEIQLSADQEDVKGHLKIVCPVEIGQLYFGLLFARFIEKYPEITLEIELANRKVDLYAEELDILFSINNKCTPTDSNIESFDLFNLHKVLVASPKYLEKNGTPLKPSDLSKHKVIRVESAYTAGNWAFFDGKQWTKQEVFSQICVNNVTLAREIAISGLGIAAIPEILASDALKNGELKAILEDELLNQPKLSLNFPKRAYLPRKYHAFIEYLYTDLERIMGKLILEIPDFITGKKE